MAASFFAFLAVTRPYYVENFTILHFFEWYYPAAGSLWNHFKTDAERLNSQRIHQRDSWDIHTKFGDHTF